MAAREIKCPSCRLPLPRDATALEALNGCPSCLKPISVFVLPGYHRSPVTGRAAEKVTGESESTCFFHASKKAAVPCDECGRFLCALCDVQVDSRHLCPTCLESGRRLGSIGSLERSRTRWDIIVWTINLGLFTCIGLPVVALANLLITVLLWRAPASRVVRSRVWTLVGTGVAVLLTLAALIGMIAGRSHD
jgi:hypothetical protein